MPDGETLEKIQGKSPDELPEDIKEILSFDNISNRYIIELPDENIDVEYDDATKRWVSRTDATIEFQQKKKAELARLKEEKLKKKGERERKNTAVYVTGLPKDTTTLELEETFGKYGVLAEDLKTGEKRVKVYRNGDGTVQGDGLVVYVREESVGMAVELLDKTQLRPGVTIHVSPADFSHKPDKAATKVNEEDTKKLSFKEKVQLKRKIEKLKNKVESWEDDDELAEKKRARLAKYDKVVILKHCFTLKELAEDPTAVLDITEDIREGCEEIGEVTNVVLYDQEPEGIVSVRFASAAAADLCVSKMNGRFFAGQKLKAFKPVGDYRYKKSGKDDEEREQQRLHSFGEWLDS